MKQFGKYSVDTNGVVINTSTGRVLKQELTKEGYLRVTLCEEGTPKRFFVHRLMAQLFLGNVNGLDVNHIDGVKTNNQLSNLEIVTRQYNIQHSIENKLRKLGEKTFNATLTDSEVHKVCEMISKGMLRNQILREITISKHVFDDIRRRKSWKHISKDYVWQKRSTTIESIG